MFNKHDILKAMKRNTFIILISLAFTGAGCFSSKVNSVALAQLFTPVPESSKKLDIPYYDKGHQFNGYPFVYWHLDKQKEKQLKLEQPETSSSDFIFRTWVTRQNGTYNQPHSLIEITRNEEQYNATIYFMKVNFVANTLSETITDYKKVTVTPLKNSWQTVIDSLYILKADSLPTDEQIPEYYRKGKAYNNNSATYSFEFASKNLYRFYQYNDLQRASQHFWQPKNVLAILRLLDQEFNWTALEKEYFK